MKLIEAFESRKEYAEDLRIHISTMETGYIICTLQGDGKTCGLGAGRSVSAAIASAIQSNNYLGKSSPPFLTRGRQQCETCCGSGGLPYPGDWSDEMVANCRSGNSDGIDGLRCPRCKGSGEC